ncbi:uncharacterized protein K02A2.6-like isoform X3 [Stomoxys calcitrans]|uniref:uncharacterized protein K02A2.6-like isoform X3 n=1 Tax=Stomoxys calcitrans TaxID=35570 RepID=UPI0027E38E7E|nr:uncharacterized protein K02A2.6-like isoform X3 [Stomoxys calcitrans]
MAKLPRPKNVDEVRRFLGMVTYYSRFIPNMATITHPLRSLLEKGNKFVWSKQSEEAFIKLKQEILHERVLVPYDQSLPLILICDASPTGVAAVLSHIVDGCERPVAFISRALTKAEQNYSQLDREALAIIFAVDKLFMYLHGREFTLVTDNRPLSRIFHQHAKTPAMTSQRLLQYASFLQGFNYKLEHRKADQIAHVDCLSRAPLSASSKFLHFLDKETKDIQDQTINEISSISITATSVAKETQNDDEFKKLKESLLNGGNTDPEYSIQDGVLFKGTRVMIPATLRDAVLRELHHTHIGVVRMKQLARKYCFWKEIDSDIETLVKSCPDCAMIRRCPPKVETHKWEDPIENFQRVHIDYAGPFQNHYFLVLVDAKSKWPEIKVIKQAPTSDITISLLQSIFSTHGLPQIMVSDNATIFQSAVFRTFCENNGIIQKFIAPGHPATNGLAERHIQTLKRKLKAMQNEKLPLRLKVQEIVTRYRATPLSNGKSPANLYLGRDLRIKLDSIRPTKLKKSEVVNPKVRKLGVGERVQVRWFSKGVPTWKFGTVLQKLGNIHYSIKLDNNYILKRHINQLYKSMVYDQNQPTLVTGNPPQKEPQIEEVIIQRNQTQPQAPSESQPPASAEPQLPETPLSIRRSNRVRRLPARFQDHVPY